jgi:hypothetical protein
MKLEDNREFGQPRFRPKSRSRYSAVTDAEKTRWWSSPQHTRVLVAGLWLDKAASLATVSVILKRKLMVAGWIRAGYAVARVKRDE